MMTPLTCVLALVQGDAPADSAAAAAATSTGTSPTGPTGQQLEQLAGTLSTMFGPTITHTTWLGWLTLLGGIFFGLVAGRIVQWALRGASEKMKQRGWPIRAVMFQNLAGPANLAFIAAGIGFGFQGLYFPPESKVDDFLLKAVAFLNILAIGWFLYNLIDLVDMALRRLTAKSATKIDDTVVMLVRKALRIFLLVMFVLFVAQNFFGANITAWLAGLGIAGLAVSLAAQDTLKNLFGSITVLISRPFGLGDRIIFGPYDGTVENISFRDTKIRTIAGHLVTVPNMRFTDGTVENISRRPWLSRSLNVAITCDTPPEKVQEAVKLIRDLLAQPEFASTFDLQKWPPRVFFNEFNADHLNIQVMYWYQLTEGRDLWAFQAQAEQFNMRLLRTFAERGIEFAFPTRTLFLAGDPKRELAVRVNGREDG